MDTIVAATQNAPLLSQLAQARSARGPRRVLTAASSDELERILEQGSPAVIVADTQLEGVWDLVRRVKVEGKNGECRIPVVLLDGPRPQPFVIVPEARVSQPHDGAKVAAVCDDLIVRRATAHRLFAQEVALEFATNPEQLEKAGELFEALISATPYNDHDQVAIGTSFREAMGNAAEHGNKKDETKKIRVLYLKDEERIAWVITDEGPGFDHRKFLARADEVSALEHTRSRRATEARPGGLGVFIMKKTCDFIGFNDSGNSIFMMKYLPGHERPRQPM